MHVIEIIKYSVETLGIIISDSYHLKSQWTDYAAKIIYLAFLILMPLKAWIYTLAEFICFWSAYSIPLSALQKPTVLFLWI